MGYFLAISIMNVFRKNLNPKNLILFYNANSKKIVYTAYVNYTTGDKTNLTSKAANINENDTLHKKYSPFLASINQINTSSLNKKTLLIYLNRIFRSYEKAIEIKGINTQNELFLNSRDRINIQKLAEIEYLLKYLNKHDNYKALIDYMTLNIYAFDMKELAFIFKIYVLIDEKFLSNKITPEMQVVKLYSPSSTSTTLLDALVNRTFNCVYDSNELDLYDIFNMYVGLINAKNFIKLDEKLDNKEKFMYDTVEHVYKIIDKSIIVAVNYFKIEEIDKLLYADNTSVVENDFKIKNKHLWFRLHMFHIFHQYITDKKKLLHLFDEFFIRINKLQVDDSLSEKYYVINTLAKFFSTMNQVIKYKNFDSKLMFQKKLLQKCLEKHTNMFIDNINLIENLYDLEGSLEFLRLTNYLNDKQTSKVIDTALKKLQNTELTSYEYFVYMAVYSKYLSMRYVKFNESTDNKIKKTLFAIIDDVSNVKANYDDLFLAYSDMFKIYMPNLKEQIEMIQNITNQIKNIDLFSLPYFIKSKFFLFNLFKLNSNDEIKFFNLIFDSLVNVISTNSNAFIYVPSVLSELIIMFEKIQNNLKCTNYLLSLAVQKIILDYDEKVFKNDENLSYTNEKIEYNYEKYMKHLKKQLSFILLNSDYVVKHFNFIYDQLVNTKLLDMYLIGQLKSIINCLEHQKEAILTKSEENKNSKLFTQLLDMLHRKYIFDVIGDYISDFSVEIDNSLNDTSMDICKCIRYAINHTYHNDRPLYDAFRIDLARNVEILNIDKLIKAHSRDLSTLNNKLSKLTPFIIDSNIYLTKNFKQIWNVVILVLKGMSTSSELKINDKNNLFEFLNVIKILQLFNVFDFANSKAYEDTAENFKKLLQSSFKIVKNQLTHLNLIDLIECLSSLKIYDKEILEHTFSSIVSFYGFFFEIILNAIFLIFIPFKNILSLGEQKCT